MDIDRCKEGLWKKCMGSKQEALGTIRGPCRGHEYHGVIEKKLDSWSSHAQVSISTSVMHFWMQK